MNNVVAFLFDTNNSLYFNETVVVAAKKKTESHNYIQSVSCTIIITAIIIIIQFYRVIRRIITAQLISPLYSEEIYKNSISKRLLIEIFFVKRRFSIILIDTIQWCVNSFLPQKEFYLNDLFL